MVTNYPQQLSASTVSAPGSMAGKRVQADDGVFARVMGRLGQWICSLRGHDAILHFEGNRVMMRCTSCGYDTPGWEISGRGPRHRYDGDARRHLLAPQRHRLVLRKSA